MTSRNLVAFMSFDGGMSTQTFVSGNRVLTNYIATPSLAVERLPVRAGESPVPACSAARRTREPSPEKLGVFVTSAWLMGIRLQGLASSQVNVGSLNESVSTPGGTFLLWSASQ